MIYWPQIHAHMVSVFMLTALTLVGGSLALFLVALIWVFDR